MSRLLCVFRSPVVMLLTAEDRDLTHRHVNGQASQTKITGRHLTMTTPAVSQSQHTLDNEALVLTPQDTGWLVECRSQGAVSICTRGDENLFIKF